MGFSGDLKKLPLADVFQSIHQNSLTGALAIRAPRGDRLVSFESGFVTGCALPEGEDQGIGAELVRRRVVEDKDVRPSRFFRRKGNLKNTLKKRRLLESEQFCALARTLVLERIYDCFLLEEGTFEFLEDYDRSRFDEDEVAANLRIAPGEILMEAMRRIDEWKRIRRSVPSLREVYVATREPTEEDGAVEGEIISLAAAGTLDLQGLLGQLPYNRFQGIEAVAQLVAAGDMRVATAPEYLRLAREAEGRGDLEGAASHYQHGLSYERGNEELNRGLIAILERSGKRQAAADERKRYAGVLLEQGERQAACEQYAAAAELAPADPLPLERLLDLQVEDKATAKAEQTAERLVSVYMQLGLGEKAKGVFPRLLMLKPRDERLRERLAETHAALNEHATAATILKELATEELERGDVAGATRRLRRALELHPSDEKAQGLLRDLETGEHSERKRRRRRYVVTAVAGVVGGALLAWGSYEALGLWYLRDSSRRALEQMALEPGPQGVLDALVTHQATRDAFPWTVAAAWGDETMVRLGKLYLSEVDRAEDQLLLGPTPGEPAPLSEVVEQLNEALSPVEGPRLEDVVLEAQEALRADQREAAQGALSRALQRADAARIALVRAGPRARKHPGLQELQQRLLQVQPLLHLVQAQLAIEHGPTRALLDEAAARRLAETLDERVGAPAPSPDES